MTDSALLVRKIGPSKAWNNASQEVLVRGVTGSNPKTGGWGLTKKTPCWAPSPDSGGVAWIRAERSSASELRSGSKDIQVLSLTAKITICHGTIVLIRGITRNQIPGEKSIQRGV